MVAITLACHIKTINRPERRAEPEIFDKCEGFPIRRGTQSKGVLRLHYVPLWMPSDCSDSTASRLAAGK